MGVPLFGRTVTKLTITTAGGLLTGDKSSSLQVPSFIAPFMTTKQPSDRDEVVFYDLLSKGIHVTHCQWHGLIHKSVLPGGELFVMWDRHFGSHDKTERLKVQLRITADGTIRFIYNGFHQAVVTDTASSGLPVLIGLMDGFSAPRNDNTGWLTLSTIPVQWIIFSTSNVIQRLMCMSTLRNWHPLMTLLTIPGLKSPLCLLKGAAGPRMSKIAKTSAPDAMTFVCIPWNCIVQEELATLKVTIHSYLQYHYDIFKQSLVLS